jgi:hypothetical protein
MYGIPKTVLWRRVQKDIGCYALSRRAKLRQRYLPHAKEAAVRALENGEKINKVASMYKVNFVYCREIVRENATTYFALNSSTFIITE